MCQTKRKVSGNVRRSPTTGSLTNTNVGVEPVAPYDGEIFEQTPACLESTLQALARTLNLSSNSSSGLPPTLVFSSTLGKSRRRFWKTAGRLFAVEGGISDLPAYMFGERIRSR